MLEKFFYLIRLSIGTEEVRPGMMTGLSAQDWASLYKLAKKQAMAGIVFGGIEKLPAGERPPRGLLMQWIAVAEQIKSANRLLNRKNFARVGSQPGKTIHVNYFKIDGR